jgi:hypothetical protein
VLFFFLSLCQTFSNPALSPDDLIGSFPLHSQISQHSCGEERLPLTLPGYISSKKKTKPGALNPITYCHNLKNLRHGKKFKISLKRQKKLLQWFS